MVARMKKTSVTTRPCFDSPSREMARAMGRRPRRRGRKEHTKTGSGNRTARPGRVERSLRESGALSPRRAQKRVSPPSQERRQKETKDGNPGRHVGGVDRARYFRWPRTRSASGRLSVLLLERREPLRRQA